MPLSPEQFVSEMLLTVDTDTLASMIPLARAELWPMYFVVEVVNIDPVTTPNPFPLAAGVVEVLRVALDGQFLTRAFESTLDVTTPQWRSSQSGRAANYLWAGEQPRNTLRLYPFPTGQATCHVLEAQMPPAGAVSWHNMFIALRTLQRLAIADPMRARLPLSEFAAEVLRDMMETV
jgi:hypothetical protein